MAVNITNPMYVKFIGTFTQIGTTYNITGTTAEPEPTTDGSTIFNVEIPDGYSMNKRFIYLKKTVYLPQKNRLFTPKKPFFHTKKTVYLY